MPIPASISIMNVDGSLDTIYNHWCGNLSYLGILLVIHYTSPDKVRQLIDLGNVSSVDRRVNPTTSKHSLYNPESGVTVAYGRDCGATKQEAIHFDNFEDYCKSNMIQEYNYIYNLGQWFIYKVNNEKKPTSFNDFVNLSLLV